MKKTMFIIISLLVVLLISCSRGPEGSQEPPVVQKVRINDTMKPRGYFSLEEDQAKYCLRINSEMGLAELYIKVFDNIKDEWQEGCVKFSGTCSMEEYEKVLTDTPTYKETTKTWMVAISFNKAELWNPETLRFEESSSYKPFIHSYDGVFDIRYLSNYGTGKNYTGGYSAVLQNDPGTVFLFEQTMNSIEKTSEIIGLGEWIYKQLVLWELQN